VLDWSDEQPALAMLLLQWWRRQRSHAGISCRTLPTRISLGAMRFNLKCLYHEGVILDAEEFRDAPTYIGSLVIEENLNADGMIRQARLVGTVQNALRDIVAPLLDAEVVSMDENQMMVRGYQFNTEDRMGLRHTQCWLLRPVADKWHDC
jgi:hypothetical protein